MMVTVQIKKLNAAASLPEYQTSGAAGMDLCACIAEQLTIAPNAVQLVPTGIAISLPEGLEAQVRPRSGLALKNSITVLNAPGTIDSDYRGEIAVILMNLGATEFVVAPGMRIAQLVISRYERAELIAVEELEATTRGTGGFGHTGV